MARLPSGAVRGIARYCKARPDELPQPHRHVEAATSRAVPSNSRPKDGMM
jgi:hypothetical protein